MNKGNPLEMLNNLNRQRKATKCKKKYHRKYVHLTSFAEE